MITTTDKVMYTYDDEGTELLTGTLCVLLEHAIKQLKVDDGSYVATVRAAERLKAAPHFNIVVEEDGLSYTVRKNKFLIWIAHNYFDLVLTDEEVKSVKAGDSKDLKACKM